MEKYRETQLRRARIVATAFHTNLQDMKSFFGDVSLSEVEILTVMVMEQCEGRSVRVMDLQSMTDLPRTTIDRHMANLVKRNIITLSRTGRTKLFRFSDDWLESHSMTCAGESGKIAVSKLVHTWISAIRDISTE